ncbi:MAG: glycogen synthase [Chlamydiota bacterium]
MKIVQLAAEFAPFAKAGGLGEVIVGLSRQLTRQGNQVDVIIPKYDFIELSGIQMEIPDFKCLESGRLHANTMWKVKSEECNVHLLEARHPAGFFHRGKIYGCADDIARFIYFSRAALEYLKLRGETIDVLHLHDWHVSLCAPLVKDLFASELAIKSILLTIHNVEYQGRCKTVDLDRIGLKGNSYLTREKLQDNDPFRHPKTINLLKGGIIYADAINAVSPTYAKEILTPQFGFHLDTTLQSVKEKLTGILNGIDQMLWDPALDPYLTANYNPKGSLEGVLLAKEKNKTTLRTQFNLSPKKGPWIGAVTRLAHQKGPELIEEAASQTLQLGGVFLLLGSPSSPEMQKHFEQLKTKHASSRGILIQLNYDEALAHQIYSALDFLIVPSLYEPCGLTQMIAMRYGTIPIVHATGGLKDTVFDCENLSVPTLQRNGFVFLEPTPASMNTTLGRAVHLFRANPTQFQSLIKKALQLDFSWKKPAEEYLKLYRKIIANQAECPADLSYTKGLDPL